MTAISYHTGNAGAGGWPVCRCVLCLLSQDSPPRTKHQLALCLPVELIILEHFILLTEGRDGQGVMNGHSYTLPGHPGAHPGTQPDDNQVTWLAWYLTKDGSRSSPSVIRKSLLSACSNIALLNLLLKKHMKLKCAVYGFHFIVFIQLRKKRKDFHGNKWQLSSVLHTLESIYA